MIYDKRDKNILPPKCQCFLNDNVRAGQCVICTKQWHFSIICIKHVHIVHPYYSSMIHLYRNHTYKS